MKFENLINQTLHLVRSKSAILKIKQTEYKTKRLTTFVKKMKSILKKNVRDRSSNLLRLIKQREKFSSKIDTRLNDFTKIMKKIIVNIDNLMNCVFFLINKKILNLNNIYFKFRLVTRFKIRRFSISLFFFRLVIHLKNRYRFYNRFKYRFLCRCRCFRQCCRLMKFFVFFKTNAFIIILQIIYINTTVKFLIKT